METIDFGHGVPPMSRLVYGAWRLADDHDRSLSHVVEKVEACLDQGITTFDHADIYGDYECEALFGRALHGHSTLKQKMQIVTKCDIMLVSPDKFPRRRTKHYDTSAAHIRDSVENSLRRLGVEVIDMLLIHRPDPFTDHHETGGTLDALIAEGKIRGAGVSNFMPWDVDLLQSAMQNPILTNQIEISLLNKSAFTNGQIATAQRQAMPLMAWSPLGGGELFMPGSEVGKRIMPRLTELGQDQGVAAEAVALAWLLAHPARIMPVVGTNSMGRIRHISDALNVELDRETWFELWALSEGAEVP
ncbi:aldo/keto reductase [Roseitalea porphyridii]|uniref:Oxidoreductase n=1 Tax=Roseitalea porphyridii TaxID=1852022 RepID=A0A4P6V1S0_9HYPH|nr:aldo/keto reductase [Roseitalea porphyridii]QBK30350.1 oxidoreductase [Roseitalea porphyridii]